MLELPPLSLYIHVPWCIRKCPYCDFNSHEQRGSLPEREYIAALCEDFDRDYEQAGGRTIQSIFIGGGTPSLFEPNSYDSLLQHIQNRATLAEKIEITLEANPGTAEADKFTGFRNAGINRLSLGIQSFNDSHLQTLGRIHDSRQATQAIEIARKAGFDNFNLDLMHGLSEQTPAQAEGDLLTAIQAGPTHLSWYQLTIEPNTVFYRHPPALPDERLLNEISSMGQQLLEEHSYHQYEVSAYAKPGKASIHNKNYWLFGDYIGVGAGAHGKISSADNNSITRTRKLKQPEHYLKNSVGRVAEAIEIEELDRPLEFLLNALRLREGFTVRQYEQRTGLPFSTIAKKVEYLISKELLVRPDDRITTSEQGYRLLNSVLEEFL